MLVLKWSYVLPVAQRATKVWACFLRICLVDGWIFSLDKKCSMKSWGVTEARSHFSLLRTSNSICCEWRRPEVFTKTNSLSYLCLCLCCECVVSNALKEFPCKKKNAFYSQNERYSNQHGEDKSQPSCYKNCDKQQMQYFHSQQCLKSMLLRFSMYLCRTQLPAVLLAGQSCQCRCKVSLPLREQFPSFWMRETCM